EETLYDVSDKVATITLNRPDKLNAWTAVMEREVRAAFEQAERDDQVRVIVLTGAGRGFCAGADMSLLKHLADRGVDKCGEERVHVPREKRKGVRPDYVKRYSYFQALTKPVISAINGPVVGLGLVIALYCDLRWASESARFSTTFARRGLIAEYGMAWMLPRLVGLPNALDLLLSASTIDAHEALRFGLVNQVFSQDAFPSKVQENARELASAVSPRSLRVIKRQVYDALFQTLGEAFEASEREMLASLRS